MIENKEIWIEEQLQILQIKAANLKEPYLKNNGFEVIKGALGLMPTKINNHPDWEEFKGLTSKLIEDFPLIDKPEKEQQKAYQLTLSTYKQFLLKKYQVVPKGYYVLVWMPLGIGIGLPFGLLFKNIALGIPIGLGIGLAIGSVMDNKAKKENRQL